MYVNNNFLFMQQWRDEGVEHTETHEDDDVGCDEIFPTLSPPWMRQHKEDESHPHFKAIQFETYFSGYFASFFSFPFLGSFT